MPTSDSQRTEEAMTTPTRNIREGLRELLATRDYVIPRGEGFEGTGAPGLYLEHLLGLKTSNVDVPDAGAWEVKFSSGNSLITLFHKDAYSRGRAIRAIINRWGWIGRNGRQSFRHTICGQSDRFEVADDAGEIRVRRIGYDDVVPHWPHDVLLTAFARKLGNLIHVRGTWRRRDRHVSYEAADFLTGARATQLIRFIVAGTICIDFDAYIRESGAIRNHGTKFRIKPEDLHTLYASRQRVR